MSKFKSILLSLTAFALVMVPASVFAQNFGSTSTVVVQVVNQDGFGIPGNWYLYQGTGDEGMIFRNGTWGETFLVPYGTYYLKGEVKEGYGSFEVTSENPQNTIAHQTTVFRLVYTAGGEAASADGETTGDAGTTPTTDDEAMTEEEPSTVESDSPSDSPLEERLSHTGRPVGVNRADIREPSFDSSADFGAPALPVQLAVTGPAGTLGLLMLASALGSFWLLRRRQA